MQAKQDILWVLYSLCPSLFQTCHRYTEPIQRLTRKNATFRWEEDQQVAFERLKKLLASADTLAFFDADSRTRIVADASPKMVLRLQAYSFKVIYKPRKTNIADALSRLNRKVHLDFRENYDVVQAIAKNSVPCALSPSQIEEVSYGDPELNLVKDCITSGDWSKCNISAYLHVKNKLCTYGHLVLRGSRIVISQVFRLHVLKLAHEGHQGVVKTKYRLRSKVWWPNIDADAEKLCKSFHGCQVVSKYAAPVTMARTVPPSGTWQDCANFCSVWRTLFPEDRQWSSTCIRRVFLHC